MNGNLYTFFTKQYNCLSISFKSTQAGLGELPFRIED